MADWNCPGYAANISDRQCLINREVRRHRDPNYPCETCLRWRQLTQALPDLAQEICHKYRDPWLRRKFTGQDIGGFRS